MPTNLFGQEVAELSLTAKYIEPPFSVLRAGAGRWQERKTFWISKYDLLGIEIEDTEEGKAFVKGGALEGMPDRMRKFVQKKLKKKVKDDSRLWQSHSIFDPVLAELMYKWFCPRGGRILDPFSGEGTKGIVAGALGFDYTGVDLRQRQIDANIAKAKRFNVPACNWLCGDSIKLGKIIKPVKDDFDFVFTSPPYYDLEQYTTSNEKDSSTFGTYAEFITWYKTVFEQAVARLKNNRFLAVKIAEIRDKVTGEYRNFVGDNIRVFNELGLKYYNEIIFVSPIATASLRTQRFYNSRKTVKVHQNVLVFFKTDEANISKAVRKEFRGLI